MTLPAAARGELAKRRLRRLRQNLQKTEKQKQ
jgi:hypothetical protein